MKLAIFDLDGTLAQTYQADRACYLEAYDRALGIRDISTDWRAYPHVTDSSIAREAVGTAWGREPSMEELSLLRDTLLGLLREQPVEVFQETPGAGAFLAALWAHPHWAAVVATGGWRSTARLKLERCGLPIDGLELATAEDDTTRARIVEAAVRRAGRRWGVGRFERTVLVGDAPWDVQTARALSLPFVGIGVGRKARQLVEAGAQWVLPDFGDSRAALRSLEESLVPGQENSEVE